MAALCRVSKGKMKLFVFLLLSSAVVHAYATKITTVNRCSFGGRLQFTGSDGNISPGGSIAKKVPQGWSGRVSLPSTSDANTLAEFAVGTDGHDSFDISLVDGYNVGLQIEYTGSGCIKNGKPVNSSVACSISLDQCPPAYRTSNSCSNPAKDAQTNYSRTMKGICPDAYSWSMDATSTYTCNSGGNYTVTFCPESRSLALPPTPPTAPSAPPTAPTAPSAPPTPPSAPVKLKTKTQLQTGAKAGIAVGAILAASMIAGLAIYSAYLARNRWFLLQEDREDDQYFKSLPALPPRFTFKELKSATWKFSKPLGTGGFGTVYEGRIADGTGVAVKKLDGGRQGRKEFRAEVATIGSISHVNLVRLRGFCSENFQRLLVYELLPNGSLDKWLFSRDRPLLTWSQRFNIAVGTARGLAYLHSECREPVLHLDVKPENILLDASMTPKVSDFGMSKLIDRDKSRVETTMRGTPGYMAPEWLLHNGATTKCDVYSYGLVLVELLAGRRNVEFISAAAGHGGDGVQLTSACYFPAMLVSMVRSSSGFDPTDVVDKRLGGDVDAEQVRRLVNAALLCIQEEPELRPSMEVVMQILETSLGVVDATCMNFPF